MVGTQELPVSASFAIYPVPNNGLFKVSIRYPVDGIFNITVYTQLGAKFYELRDVKTIGGIFELQVDLRPVTNGIYFIVLKNDQCKIVKRFFVTN